MFFRIENFFWFSSFFSRLTLVTVWLLGLLPCAASVRLPAVLGDQMVLQRDIDLNIWGWAAKGEKITLRFRGAYYYTEAGRDGKWSVHIPPQHYGGPYLMEINDIVIRDVLIGDVWLCSGQSNMETPIKRLVERFPEINESNNHMIRYFKVPTQNSIVGRQEDIPSGERWHSGIASDVMNWTALAYFYAMESYRHNGIPVGMIVSSLGGSGIERWIDQKYLKKFPELLLDQHAVDSLRLAERDLGADYWTEEEYNDSDWPTVLVPEYWKKAQRTTKGVRYYRKNFTVPEAKEGRHAKLYLGTLIDSDSVYVNGHFVGSTAYRYPPRIYDIPAGILHAGRNNLTVRLRSDGGDGGFTPDKSYKIRLDDVCIDLAGEWRWQIAIDQEEVEKYKSRLRHLGQVGSGLYNGMIYPLRGYGIKGVLWYQGEANAGDPSYYQSYLTSLISNWRAQFGQPQLPFLMVQLPNFMAKDTVPAESNWARIREAQFEVSKEVPLTALAVTYDLGEWNDIHPLNKKDMAKRLFLCALKMLYGEQVVASGPRFKHMRTDGNQVVVSFNEIGKGLAIGHGKKLQHFAIAGSDRKFVWANAIIRGNEVVLSHPKISNPQAVRYAWSNNPEDANLVNKEGMLAVPFRTDNW
ncbi:sialate O-acetylesterase [Sphingobacterium sp. G1-14]|uniref:sialate O-acetylesterase n=1 Tax=Sphingobacterium TaxID=28453 RepID=UPI0018DFFE98|nr:sialate O-acetylesterase [Sphingobacterium sp. G1-14]